ncbi:hypothetical protein EDC65_1772 [Stella humosa]|uniref:Spy/CpxP family protein refolding chaperone n=1 Tax=Stella humosa TaxID=94 RepID=A0A3N1M8F7_9PROT|nr:hypothetical protein [Stella humosa]ROP99977.1 hypothetical protein EDC65_1772 [Stella humosa]BBK30792.1 hypothetical protein STHU_14260 [Stella humosa]
MASHHVRMSKFRLGAIALFSAVLFAQTASAAAPGPDGNRGHLNRLLHNPTVIAHLGLTAEQARAAQGISNAVIESQRVEFETALKPATKAERVPLVKDLFIAVNADTFKRLESVISAAQNQRLRQIEIHTFGVRAFGRPAVIQYLELTPAQTERLSKVGDAMGDQLSGLHKSSAMSAAEKKEATGRIRTAALAEARQAMSPEQWVRWELLIGAEFRL